MLAFKSSSGQCLFSDPCGCTVTELSRLESFYEGISDARPEGGVFEIPRSGVLEGRSLCTMLALEVRAVPQLKVAEMMASLTADS